MINLSSELFLFYYITKQFENDQEQLPKMIFFCCIYDEQCRNIYQIQSEKQRIKKKKKKKKERLKVLKKKKKLLL